MSKGVWAFRPAALTRAVKAAQEAGLTVADSKIDPVTGNIVLLFGREASPRIAPPAVSLYRHFDEADNLLYVGIAIDPVRRLGQHLASRWYDRISRIEIERYPSRHTALAAEATAIRTENPQFNIAGKAAA
jgi:GIY-YIG catalytic domain